MDSKIECPSTVVASRVVESTYSNESPQLWETSGSGMALLTVAAVPLLVYVCGCTALQEYCLSSWFLGSNTYKKDALLNNRILHILVYFPHRLWSPVSQ